MEPVSPSKNAIIERFNKTYREDVLDATLFHSIEHAKEVTGKWVDEYNNDRPHQSLNYQTLWRMQRKVFFRHSTLGMIPRKKPPR